MSEVGEIFIMSDVLDERKDVQLSVVEFGAGVVEPTEKYSDGEVSYEIASTQEAVQDKHIVCMDERVSLDGEPVRLKTAGGAAMSAFEGAILGDWYLLSSFADGKEDAVSKGQANRVYDFVADKLVKAGVALGNHIDNQAEGDSTHCGARDGAPKANKKLAEQGEEFVAVVEHFMGPDFNKEMYDDVIDRAKELEEAGFFDGWNPARSIETDTDLGAVTEVLDGQGKNKGDDPTNARHGHFAEAVNYNTRAGYSNNRDASTIPYFQIDKEAIDKISEKLGRNGYESQLIRHGIYAYSVAIAHGLIKNQRVSQT